MATSFEPLFGEAGGTVPAWLVQLSEAPGFTLHAAYRDEPSTAELPGDLPQVPDKSFDDAFAAGEAQGRQLAAAEFAERDALREELGLSLARLDDEMSEQLSARLAETVAALCEQVLAPLALDQHALEQRCSAAARLLGDAVEGASLHLHPDDIEFLGRNFRATWHVLADDSLERGTIRLASNEVEVLDGPAVWRAALANAFAQC